MAKIRVDFNVTSTPYTIRVEDMSEWGPISGKPTIIEVTSPGYENGKTHWFDQGKANIFNTSNLEMNCAECDDKQTMLDGVYTIKVTGSPDISYKKDYYLKTDLFEMEMNRVLISRINENSYTDTFKKHFLEIKFIMWAAEAHLENDSIRRSTELFRLAVDELEDLKGC